MRMKPLLAFILLTLPAAGALADKPVWAGKGGKPSEQQIDDHRSEMREKNDDKPQRDTVGNEHQEDGKQKSKNKEKSKDKGDLQDQDQDREQDKDRDRDREEQQKRDGEQHKERLKSES